MDEEIRVALESEGRQARELIEAGYYVPCKICLDAFRRVRLTLRYCATCGHAFCEGEHGNFARGRGTCVICGARKGYKA